MASLDAESLFTNVPLDETIGLVLDGLDRLECAEKWTKKDLRLALEFATKHNIFIFNKTFYQQIDGVAMGSPLGPSFANLFLAHHETKWLDDCPVEFKPKFY